MPFWLSAEQWYIVYQTFSVKQKGQTSSELNHVPKIVYLMILGMTQNRYNFLNSQKSLFVISFVLTNFCIE